MKSIILISLYEFENIIIIIYRMNNVRITSIVTSSNIDNL